MPPIQGLPLATLPHRFCTSASFLASVEAMSENGKVLLMGDGKVRDHTHQTAPEGARLLCLALWPTTEIPHVLANGYYRGGVDSEW